MKSRTYLPVSEGSIVEVTFDYKPPENYLVTDVKKRYGRTSNGKIPMAPLVTGISKLTGKSRSFDVSYVTRIIERPKNVAPRKNIFRDARGWIDIKGSLWCGGLYSLATHALSKLPYELERPINLWRLEELYSKQYIGRKSEDDGAVYTVDSRKFLSWVRKNHNRILFTVAELVDRETRTNSAWEDTIDLDENLDESDNFAESLDARLYVSDSRFGFDEDDELSKFNDLFDD